MAKSYCYMIQKGYGSVKIGVSDDPQARLKSLQTGNHGRLYLIASFPFDSRMQAEAMERELHARFTEDRLKGEWFRKRILRKFKDRSTLFPQIFCTHRIFNSYHDEPATAAVQQ